MAGFDTAGQIQNTYVSARNEFGRAPYFWIRYFSPSPAADIFADDPVSESLGAWDSGGPFVGCVSAPYQSRLSGSAAEGLADAQTYAASMLAAWNAVGQLKLPANNQLWCYLDQEYSTGLSLSYWDAWADYIAEYNFANLHTYPLYPGGLLRPVLAVSQLLGLRRGHRRQGSGVGMVQRAGAVRKPRIPARL